MSIGDLEVLVDDLLRDDVNNDELPVSSFVPIPVAGEQRAKPAVMPMAFVPFKIRGRRLSMPVCSKWFGFGI